MRKLVQGHGVNDHNGTVSVSGKLKAFYVAWTGMLKRCYSKKYHAKHPTYIGCTVCNEWLSLATFKEWYDSNHVTGWQLDKDIINNGNKIYNPANCRYIPSTLNTLLSNCSASRGLYPQGICFDRIDKKFIAQMAIDGKNNHLGYFDTPELAETAYKKAKSAEILRKVDLYHGIVCDEILQSLTKLAKELIK